MVCSWMPGAAAKRYQLSTAGLRPSGLRLSGSGPLPALRGPCPAGRRGVSGSGVTWLHPSAQEWLSAGCIALCGPVSTSQRRSACSWTGVDLSGLPRRLGFLSGRVNCTVLSLHWLLVALSSVQQSDQRFREGKAGTRVRFGGPDCRSSEPRHSLSGPVGDSRESILCGTVQ